MHSNIKQELGDRGLILKMQLQSIQETAPGLVGISPRSNIDLDISRYEKDINYEYQAYLQFYKWSLSSPCPFPSHDGLGLRIGEVSR